MLSLVLWRVQTVSYDEITARLREHEHTYLSLLSDLGRNALATTEYGELQQYVDKLKKNDTFDSILMTDRRNVIVVSSDHKLLSRALPAVVDDECGHWGNQNITMESGGRDIGRIHIKFCNSDLRAAFRKSVIGGITVAGLSMAVIAVAGVLIGNMLVRRLDTLNNAAGKMSEGRMDIRADISGSDEVSRLAHTFNAMTHTIKISMDSLKHREKDLREAQRVAHIGSWQWTIAGDEVAWSDELYRINGRDPKLPPPGYGEMQSCYTPESWARLREAVTRALQSGASYELDLDIVRPDGTTRHTATRGEAERDADGKIVKLQGTVQDITERKRAEDMLRKSEQQLAESQRVGKIGSWSWDIVNNTLDWSEETFRRFDKDPKTFTPTVEYYVGRIHLDDRATIQTAIQASLESDAPYHIQPRIRNENGRDWVLEGFGVVERDANGKPVRFAGTAQDITGRRTAEELMLRSLKEKDVLLKEIHHRVKNNMQVIYSLLNLQAKGIIDRTARAQLEEGRDRVLSMALIHEKLYQSKDLAHIEFREYLRSLVHSIANTYKRHEVVIDLDMDPVVLDVNVGIPCGLIANELVSNSLKYAFPDGGKGTITIGLGKKSEGDHVLTVADNGVGFPETVDFRNTASLGLQLVNVLAGQIYGTIELSKAEGTRFSITFPGSPETGRENMDQC